MTTSLEHTEKSGFPNPERIASRLIDALSKLSRDC